MTIALTLQAARDETCGDLHFSGPRLEAAEWWPAPEFESEGAILPRLRPALSVTDCSSWPVASSDHRYRCWYASLLHLLCVRIPHSCVSSMVKIPRSRRVRLVRHLRVLRLA